jgi:YjzC-like protein
MSTVTQIGARLRTGEVCPESGRYQFDGYLDGTWEPAPHAAERQIPLSRGEKFPPIRSSGKSCWWKLMQRI